MAKTIDELKSAAAVVRDATEEKENTALRIGTVLIDMIDTLSESVSINAIKGYVVIDSTSELPENPTPEQQQKGYLLNTTLYVYVGVGGDTLDGKYQSAQLKGAPGEKGDKGDSGVDLGEVVLVNDLTTGGEGSALSAEQGKILNEKIENTTAVDLSDYTAVQAWVNNSGKWEVNSSKYKGKFIPIPSDASCIAITANASLSNAYALLTTNAYSSGASVSFATGCSKTIIQAGETAKITTIPSDAKYIWTAVLSNNNDVTPQSVLFSYNIWDKINEISAELDNISFDVDNIPQKGSENFVKSGGIYDSIINYTEGFIKTTYDDVAMSDSPADVYENYPSGYQANKKRIRVLYNVRKGYKLTASCNLGSGICANVFGNRTDAIGSSVSQSNPTQLISNTTYSTDEISAIINVNGILSISLAKSDNTAFTEVEYNQYLAALSAAIKIIGLHDIINSSIAAEEDNTLFLGNLVQKSYDSNAVLSDTDADKRVTTESYMAVPKESATLRFKLPDWLQCTIRAGRSCDQQNPVSSQLHDGSTYTFDSNKMWFRICFMRLDTTAQLSVADVNEAIASGDLKIYVEGEHSNIIERNAETEKYVKAAMRPFISGQNNNSGFHNYPVFAHTSDVHGDATRFNSMVDYCDYIGVDACLVTGDMVSKEPKDSMQFINDVADLHSSMVLPCMGNHDARTLTAEEQYNSIMKYLVEKNSATTNPNEDYPTYYYKDFASKKIRVIALNIYEGTHTHDNVNFSQTQAEWFISVLASTPQNYGVLVMFHSPDKLPAKDNDHAAFYQDIVVTTTTTMANITGNPFIQIIDAFIGKSSATISYSIGSTSISVAADFTGVASGVEFIAFLNGHFHIDRIGYLPSTTYKQLNLNVSCGIAEYGGSSNAYYADCSDIPRGCVGSTQDCFNIYVIDRVTKSVRVARVGSNIAGNLTERKYMVIPYAD